jgi:hypothetical protein
MTSFHDLKQCALFEFRGRGLQYCPNGLDGSAFFTDDLAYVLFCNDHFQYCRFAP